MSSSFRWAREGSEADFAVAAGLAAAEGSEGVAFQAAAGLPEAAAPPHVRSFSRNW